MSDLIPDPERMPKKPVKPMKSLPIVMPSDLRKCLKLIREFGGLVTPGKLGFVVHYPGMRSFKVMGGRHNASPELCHWMEEMFTKKSVREGGDVAFGIATRGIEEAFSEVNDAARAIEEREEKEKREAERAARREEERLRHEAEAEKARVASRAQAKKRDAERTLAALVALDLTLLDDDALASLAQRIYDVQRERAERTS